MQAGKLFIISAPSGGGKSSLAQSLVEAEARLQRAVTHTTRLPRQGEREGVDYYFVDAAAFQAMVAAGEFLEHAQVFQNRYGTSRQAVQALLDQGKDVILTIDWQGARTIKQAVPNAVTIFILPTSRAALEERLQKRGQDSPEVIAARMSQAGAEMSHYKEFDHVVLNDDFQAALADLKAIVRGQIQQVRPFSLDMDVLLKE